AVMPPAGSGGRRRPAEVGQLAPPMKNAPEFGDSGAFTKFPQWAKFPRRQCFRGDNVSAGDLALRLSRQPDRGCTRPLLPFAEVVVNHLSFAQVGEGNAFDLGMVEEQVVSSGFH